MSKNIDSLQVLISSELVFVSTGLSQVVPIDDLNVLSEDACKIEIPLSLGFTDYTLLIYNKWTIINFSNTEISSLKGCSITQIEEDHHTLQMHLDNTAVLQINLSADGYNGPEAMSLHGPNDLLIVWN